MEIHDIYSRTSLVNDHQCFLSCAITIKCVRSSDYNTIINVAYIIYEFQLQLLRLFNDLLFKLNQLLGRDVFVSLNILWLDFNINNIDVIHAYIIGTD